jgi:hypothetical protein
VEKIIQAPDSISSSKSDKYSKSNKDISSDVSISNYDINVYFQLQNTAKSFLQTIYSEDLTDFIGSCLEDMDKRPTPEKLMKSRFHRGSQKNLKDDKNSLAEFLKQHFDEEKID